METRLAKLVSGSALALLLGACATAGTRSDLMPTYVMVFTVPEGAFTKYIPHCTGDCSPGSPAGNVTMSRVDESPIFLVEDAGFDPGQRQFSEYLYSPQWQQPDLETARKWARCVVEQFDKPIPNIGKVTVTSAYLIRVLAPSSEVKQVQRDGLGRDPCGVPELMKWQVRQ